jgi:hypothetical protein
MTSFGQVQAYVAPQHKRGDHLRMTPVHEAQREVGQLIAIGTD